MSTLVTCVRRSVYAPALIVMSLILTSCMESESAPTDPPIPPPGGAALNEIVTAGPINATSTDTLVYLSLATNAIVAKTADWDIAVRRYEIRLNGGISGAKGVVGYAMGNNAAATNDQVLAFTVDNTLPAFDSVRAASVPADNLFESDRLFENATAYLNLAGIPAANANAYWKVRTADGAFALMRVKAIVLSGATLQSVTIESRLQTGAALGVPQEVIATLTGGIAAVKFGTNAQVASPAGCNWDVQVAASFSLTVNAACSAGTYPGGSSPTFAAATSASDAPSYAAYLAGLTGPVPNSVTDTKAAFRYNLLGNNHLHPTFNTYLIKVGANVYKLQMINYYSAAGAGGNPTIRFARIK